MFKISFTRSRSPNYTRAKKIAMDLGAIQQGDAIIITLTGTQLLFAYKDLLDLLAIISKWTGCKGEFNGKEVDAYRFLLHQYNSIRECSMSMYEHKAEDHCWINPDRPGWGCKFLDAIHPSNVGTGYNVRHKHWYNYGEFNDSGQWIINKDTIFKKLKGQAEAKGLECCPFFEIDKLKRLVYEDLPDEILIDNVNYRVHYTQFYERGISVFKATNITHVSRVSIPEMKSRINTRLSRFLDYYIHMGDKDVPDRIKQKVMKESARLDELDLLDKMLCAFSDEGLCKN